MISTADMLGAALYCLAAMLCTLKGAGMSRQAHLRDRDWRWIGIAAFFAVLAVARLAQFEEFVRDRLRSMWDAHFDYDDRVFAQAGAIAVLAVLFALLLTLKFRSWMQHKGPYSLAEAACVGMAALVAARIVSFHPVDQFLYSGFGPLRIHYLMELALVSAVCMAAAFPLRR